MTKVAIATFWVRLQRFTQQCVHFLAAFGRRPDGLARHRIDIIVGARLQRVQEPLGRHRSAE
jgi:hypothetical protein